LADRPFFQIQHVNRNHLQDFRKTHTRNATTTPFWNPLKRRKKIQRYINQTKANIINHHGWKQQISRHLVPALFGLFLVLERQLSTWIVLLGKPICTEGLGTN